MVKIICLQLKNEILYVSVAQILLELLQKTKCYVFVTFFILLNKFVIFLQKRKNLKMSNFIFSSVTPKIFKLQRCTISHFKAENKLF